MSANPFYHICVKRIGQLFPNERITRVRHFVWLVVGIYQSKSVHLSDIAGKIPGRAKELSIVRRLSRFLANRGVRVRAWYAKVGEDAPWLLATHLPSRGDTPGGCRRRMRIGEMFADLIRHSFDLESTHLTAALW